MATRRELEAKLGSARGLRDIVHSMRSLAAVNIRRAEESLVTVREYMALVSELSGSVAGLLPSGYRWGGPKGRSAIFVFSSDQGLCGQFNDRIVDFALDEARKIEAGQLKAGKPGGEVALMVIGERGAEFLRERGVEPLLSDSSPRTLAGLDEAMRRLASRLFEIYTGAGFATLHLAYNRYDSAGSYTPVRDQILPPPLESLLGGRLPEGRLPEGRPGPAPRLNVAPEVMAERLLEEYLFVELYRALGESLASENGARLRAMDEAIHNIDQTIELLSQQFRIVRQEEITAEILEVISGVEALKGRARR